MARAQAALEFLTTYGWAFLVILVMIGALAYFGVLNPGNFLPDKCLFGSGIGACVDFGVSNDGTNNGAIEGVVVNNYGSDINIGSAWSMDVTGTDCAQIHHGTAIGTADISYAGGMLPTGAWPADEELRFGVFCVDANGFEGERPKITVTVEGLNLQGSDYPKTNSGVLQVRAS